MKRFDQRRLRWSLLGATAILAALTAAAQRDVPPVLTVKSETNLVLVDIVVTDKGRAVHGIDKGQFHLTEDGKEQKIVSFEEHKPGTETPVTREPLPPNVYSNKPVYPSKAAVNVLLLDGLNTPVQGQMQARAQMIDYLGKIPAGTPMAIFALSSQLKIVQGFTTDPAALVKAVKGARANSAQSPILESSLTPDYGPDISNGIANASGGDLVGGGMAAAVVKQFESDVQAFQLDVRTRMTLDALNQLAMYLNGIPGRKNLIWFSGSFPLSLDPEKLDGSSLSTMADYSKELRRTNVMLATARVAVYPVDARGLLNATSVDASAANAPCRTSNACQADGGSITSGDKSVLTGIVEDHQSMEEMAAETGGRAFVNTNDFGQAVTGAIDHGGSYYSIAYSPTTKQTDGLYHKLKLKVDGASYSLAYRQGYFSDSKSKGANGKGAQASLMLEATKRGAPPATEILFQARVLAADDPEIASGPKLTAVSTGEMSKDLKGPTKRYVVDSLIDIHGFRFEDAPDGKKTTQAELTLVGYDIDGKRLNYLDRGVELSFAPDLYAKRLETGVPLRTVIDLPAGHTFLRIAVRDVGGSKVGSMEVPLTSASK